MCTSCFKKNSSTNKRRPAVPAEVSQALALAAAAPASESVPLLAALAFPGAASAGVTAARLDAVALRGLARSLAALAGRIEGGDGSARRAALAVCNGDSSRAQTLLQAARLSEQAFVAPMGNPHAPPSAFASGGAVSELSRSFLSRFEVDTAHADWADALGGSDLWNIAPRVRTDGAWENAVRLYGSNCPSMAMTLGGRLLAVSPSIVGLTLVDPHRAAHLNAWRLDGVGLCPAVHRLACDLAAWSAPSPAAAAAPVAGFPPVPSAASTAAMDAAADRCIDTLLTRRGGQALPMQREFVGAAQTLADAARGALARGVAARRQAAGARALDTGPTTLSLTLFPVPAAVGIVVFSRASLTVLRPVGGGVGGGIGAADDAILHLCLVPHCLAPLHPAPQPLPPLAAATDAAAVGQLVPPLLDDAASMPSEPRLLRMARSIWMGSLFVAASTPPLLAPVTSCVYVPTPFMEEARVGAAPARAAGEVVTNCDHDIGPVVAAALFGVPLGSFSTELARCRAAADALVANNVGVPKGLSTHWAGLPVPAGAAAERAALAFTVRKVLFLLAAVQLSSVRPAPIPAAAAAESDTATGAVARAAAGVSTVQPPPPPGSASTQASGPSTGPQTGPSHTTPSSDDATTPLAEAASSSGRPPAQRPRPPALPILRRDGHVDGPPPLQPHTLLPHRPAAPAPAAPAPAPAAGPGPGQPWGAGGAGKGKGGQEAPGSWRSLSPAGFGGAGADADALSPPTPGSLSAGLDWPPTAGAGEDFDPDAPREVDWAGL